MSRNDKRILNNSGYSLAELLVVLSIIGILISIAGFYGHDLLVRSQVEEQTREMFTDLMNARISALQRNKFFFVTLASNQYAIYEDTFDTPDGNGSPDLGSGQDRLVKQKTTAYALDSGGTTTFDFSACGLVSAASTTDDTFDVHVVSTAAPSLDCITLSPTRILMGKWNGTACNPQ